jgi:hypothetical protein
MSDVHMQEDNRDHDDIPRDETSTNNSYQSANDTATEPDEAMSDNSGNGNGGRKAKQIHFAPPLFLGNAPLFASGYPSISTDSPLSSDSTKQLGPTVPLRSVVTSSFSVENDTSLTQHDRYHAAMQIDHRLQRNELVARPGPWPFPEHREHHHHQEYSQQDYSIGMLAPMASPESSPLGSRPPFEPVRRSFSSSSMDPPILRRSFSVGSDPLIRRSFSSSSTDLGPPTQPIKRTFYHHARTGEPYSVSSLPPDFMPPKRAKVDPKPRKPDRVIIPKNQQTTPLSPAGGDAGGGWYQQQQQTSSPSWNSRQSIMESNNHAINFHHHPAMPRTLSLPPPPSWATNNSGHHYQPPSSIAVTGANHVCAPTKLLSVQVSPGNDHDASPRGSGMWQQHTSPSMQHPWSSSPQHAAAASLGRFWGATTTDHQNRDDVESSRNAEALRDDHFDPEPYMGERRTTENFAVSRQGIFRNPPPPHSSITNMASYQQSESQDKMKLVAEAASFAESVQGRESFMEVEQRESEHEEEKKEDDNQGPIVLLATPEDKIALSETLCVVREVSGGKSGLRILVQYSFKLTPLFSSFYFFRFRILKYLLRIRVTLMPQRRDASSP